MSELTTYAYTAADVTAAFTDIREGLFAGKEASEVPQLLITAGLQGSGKTYLLEKTLLPSGQYGNYIRLYSPDFRKKHPQYDTMLRKGVLHAYEHTESFVREVCAKLFEEPFTGRYSMIVECAFDDIDLANLPALAAGAGYRIEAHIVACSLPFAFISGGKRAFRSLEKQELERFVRPSDLRSSLGNSHAVLFALENAAKTVDGSQIHLYERGLGALNDRVLRRQSTYRLDESKKLTETSTLEPYRYSDYEQVSGNTVNTPAERDEMIRECHLALSKTAGHVDQVPTFVYNALHARIVKHVYR
ncbi:zeta toxin family protein [Pseudomonas sp. COR58]|uniref:Zeta toxin family protein n=1 Tax=Pseudomonas ekonensis TaxID=2842353 RepID=A0ABS6PEC3_9PSED|nr:zeta toxin family protein [Pseudomonas ekonensis]MBV4458336.1 zeta toxin family protein [Pseudomonas ekonensis]